MIENAIKWLSANMLLIISFATIVCDDKMYTKCQCFLYNFDTISNETNCLSDLSTQNSIHLVIIYLIFFQKYILYSQKSSIVYLFTILWLLFSHYFH